MKADAKAGSAKADYRYDVTIFLIRNERPKYWDFHCPFCTAKVFELDGQLIHMRDVSNDASDSRPPIRVRCPGTNKKWCRMWFSVQLSN